MSNGLIAAAAAAAPMQALTPHQQVGRVQMAVETVQAATGAAARSGVREQACAV
jgi:hypothetical protein